MNAPITSYTELMAGIQAQVAALGVKYEDFDELACWAPGLSGKVFGLLQVRRLGPEKMFDAIRAAGLRLRIEVDPEQEARMRARIKDKFNPRNARQARMKHASSMPSSEVLSRVLKPIGRMGGKARWANKSKKERSAHMKMMVMAREKKRRQEMKRRARQRRAAHRARKQ